MYYKVPKEKEENKKDYIFISDNDFNKAIKNKFICKCFGFKYGTLKKTVIFKERRII